MQIQRNGGGSVHKRIGRALRPRRKGPYRLLRLLRPDQAALPLLRLSAEGAQHLGEVWRPKGYGGERVKFSLKVVSINKIKFSTPRSCIHNESIG